MRQKGFAHLLLIFLVLAGIGLAVYLVSQRTNLLPFAASNPISSSTPGTGNAGISIQSSPTNIIVTLDKSQAQDGVIKGPGIQIHADSSNLQADSWIIQSNKVADQFGFWTDSSGINAGQTFDNQLFISAAKAPGTYTGTAKIKYNKNGVQVGEGPMLNYTITLTATGSATPSPSATPTATPTPSPSPKASVTAAVCPSPVNAFYYPNRTSFYYSNVQSYFPTLEAGGWTNTGPAFLAYKTQQPGTVPVYSTFYNANRTSRFLTTNQAYLPTLAQGGWVNEGIFFYAFPTQAPGTVPVYSTYYTNRLDRFLTTDASYLPTLASAGWTNEGIAFYAYPTNYSVPNCKAE